MALCAMLLLHRNRLPLFCSITALLALLPLPTSIPDRINAGGGSIFLSEVTLLIVVGLVLHYGRTIPQDVKFALLVLGVLILLAALWGIINGAAVSDVWRDTRGLASALGLGSGVAISLMNKKHVSLKIFLNTCYFIVISSALVILFETFAPSSLFRIRSDEAVLYTPGSSGISEASRLIPPGAMFCVIFTAVLLGLWISRERKQPYPRILWAVISAGLIIAVLAFSRNFVVSISVIIVTSVLLYSGRIASTLRLIRLLSIMGVVSAAVWYVISQVSAKLRELGNQTLDAFQERVIHGLNPEVISVDASSTWRLTENNAAFASLAENPMGTGLGAFYRGPIAGEPFEGDYGLSYLHNSYLWIPVKFGLLSSLAIGIIIVMIIWRLYLSRRTLTSGLKAVQLAVFGLAPVFLIAPVPFSRSGGVLCAAILGVYIYCMHAHQSHRQNEPSVNPLLRE